MGQFLSQTERQVLDELDKLIDWHKDNGKKIDHITLNPRQHKAVKRISKKASADNVFDEYGKVDISETRYRGVKFELPRQTRTRYSKKLTLDMF